MPYYILGAKIVQAERRTKQIRLFFLPSAACLGEAKYASREKDKTNIFQSLSVMAKQLI